MILSRTKKDSRRMTPKAHCLLPIRKVRSKMQKKYSQKYNIKSQRLLGYILKPKLNVKLKGRKGWLNFIKLINLLFFFFIHVVIIIIKSLLSIYIFFSYITNNNNSIYNIIYIYTNTLLLTLLYNYYCFICRINNLLSDYYIFFLTDFLDIQFYLFIYFLNLFKVYRLSGTTFRR